MTTVYEVPLIAATQTFQIDLNDITYRFTLRFNQYAACWLLDISDASDALLLGGVLLVTGADLLGQHRHLGFAGALVAQTDHDADTVPSLESLGTNGHLYYLPD